MDLPLIDFVSDLILYYSGTVNAIHGKMFRNYWCGLT